MAQHLLYRLHIHAVLEHERGGGVAELVGGVSGAVQSGLGEVLFHQGVDVGAADALVPGGEEEGVLIPAADGPAHRQIPLQGGLAGVVEVDNAYLVALAQHPQRVPLDVRQVQADQLRDPQAAVEKNSQDAVVPLLVGAVHAGKQLQALVQGQILGQVFAQFG